MKLIYGETLIFKKLQSCQITLGNPGKVLILVIFKFFFPKDSAEDFSSWLHLNIVKWTSFPMIFVKMSQDHPKNPLG